MSTAEQDLFTFDVPRKFDAPSKGGTFGAPRDYGGHTGADFAWGTGEGVGLPRAGRVRFAGQTKGYGNRVEVEHDDGRVTTYSHLDSLAAIKQGDDLDEGSLVGHVGATGHAHGPHLHYEVLDKGHKINPLTTDLVPVRGAKAVTPRSVLQFDTEPDDLFHFDPPATQPSDGQTQPHPPAPSALSGQATSPTPAPALPVIHERDVPTTDTLPSDHPAQSNPLYKPGMSLDDLGAEMAATGRVHQALEQQLAKHGVKDVTFDAQGNATDRRGRKVYDAETNMLHDYAAADKQRKALRRERTQLLQEHRRNEALDREATQRQARTDVYGAGGDPNEQENRQAYEQKQARIQASIAELNQRLGLPARPVKFSMGAPIKSGIDVSPHEQTAKGLPYQTEAFNPTESAENIVRQEELRQGPGLAPLEQRIAKAEVAHGITPSAAPQVARAQSDIAAQRIKDSPIAGPVAASWEKAAEWAHRIANVANWVANSGPPGGGNIAAIHARVTAAHGEEPAHETDLPDAIRQPLLKVGQFLNRQAEGLTSAAKLSDTQNHGFFAYTLPKAATSAGFTVTELATIKRVTGASLPVTMGSLGLMDNLDKPAQEQAAAVAKGYFLGQIFEALPELKVKQILQRIPSARLQDLIAGASETRLQQLAAIPSGAVIGGGLAAYEGKDKEHVLADALTWAGVSALPEVFRAAKQLPETVLTAEQMPEAVREVVAKATSRRPVVVWSESGERSAVAYADPQDGTRTVVREVSADEARAAHPNAPRAVLPDSAFDVTFGFPAETAPPEEPQLIGTQSSAAPSPPAQTQEVQTHDVAAAPQANETVVDATAEQNQPGVVGADGETNAPATNITSFTTSQGSTYTLTGQSTQRNKTQHVGHDPNDTGLKKPSDRTVYLDEDAAREVGMWNTLQSDGKRLLVRAGEVLLTSINPKTGGRGLDGQFTYSTQPEVGKSPLELWQPEDVEGHAGYRNNHPGTPIKELAYAAPPIERRATVRTPATDLQYAKGTMEKIGGSLVPEGEGYRLTVGGTSILAPDVATAVSRAREFATQREIMGQMFPAQPGATVVHKDPEIDGDQVVGTSPNGSITHAVGKDGKVHRLKTETVQTAEATPHEPQPSDAGAQSDVGVSGTRADVQPVGAGGTPAAVSAQTVGPVPESRRTVRAQFRSARDPESPRDAVLVRGGQHVPRLLTGFAKLELPDDVLAARNMPVRGDVGYETWFLYVNRAKWRAKWADSGLTRTQFVRTRGFEPLIGKVEPVADTSQGLTLRTEDEDGHELSSSVVQTPQGAAAQAEVDRAQFPEATKQELLSTQDAVARRVEESHAHVTESTEQHRTIKTLEGEDVEVEPAVFSHIGSRRVELPANVRVYRGSDIEGLSEGAFVTLDRRRAAKFGKLQSFEVPRTDLSMVSSGKYAGELLYTPPAPAQSVGESESAAPLPRTGGELSQIRDAGPTLRTENGWLTTSIDKPNKRIYVSKIFVDESARGQGEAQQLYKQFADWAAAEGYDAYVESKAKPDAIRARDAGVHKGLFVIDDEPNAVVKRIHTTSDAHKIIEPTPAPSGTQQTAGASPKFKTHADAEDWIAEKSKEYGSKRELLVSDEYKAAYPEIKRVAEIDKQERAEAAHKLRETRIEPSADGQYVLALTNRPGFVSTGGGSFGGQATFPTIEAAEAYAAKHDYPVTERPKPETAAERKKHEQIERTTPRAGTPERDELDARLSQLEDAERAAKKPLEAKVAEQRRSSRRGSTRWAEYQQQIGELSRAHEPIRRELEAAQEEDERARLEDFVEAVDPVLSAVAQAELEHESVPAGELTKLLEARARTLDVPAADVEKTARMVAMRLYPSGSYMAGRGYTKAKLPDSAADLDRMVGDMAANAMSDRHNSEARQFLDEHPDLTQDERVQYGKELATAKDDKAFERTAATARKVAEQRVAARTEKVAELPDVQPDAADVLARLPREKMSKTTGLTPTQTEFVVARVRAVADVLPGKQGSDDGEQPRGSVTIKVPGDGEYTLYTEQGADRLHRALTGKTIEQYEEAQKKAREKAAQQGESAHVVLPQMARTSEKYYTHVTPTGTERSEFVEKTNVQPVTIRGYEDLDTFLHDEFPDDAGDSGLYVVSEGTTGSKLGEGPTPKAAISAAKKKLEEGGRARVAESLTRLHGEGTISPRYKSAAPVAAEQAGGQSSYTYTPLSSVDTPQQGSLNQARELKARAWKSVQRIRQELKDEPVGGNRSNLRLELLQAESAHKEALQMEDGARQAIERRANELGQTTIRAQAEGVLKMARATDLQSLDNADLAPQVEVEQQGNHLIVNDAGRELIRRALATGPTESAFDGTTLTPPQVRKVVRSFRASVEETFHAGHSADVWRSMEELYHALTTAKRAGQGVVAISDGGKSVPHEFLHVGSFKGARARARAEFQAKFADKGYTVEQAKQWIDAETELNRRLHAPDIERLAKHEFVESLRKHFATTPGEANMSDARAVEEAAAWAAGGAEAFNVDPDVAADYISEWTKAYRERNGPDAFKYFEKQAEHVEKAINEAKRLAVPTAERDAERDAGDARPEPRSVGPGDQVGRAAEGRAAGAETGGVQALPATAGEARGDLKQRSLPATLRAKGIEAADQLYEVYHHDQSSADAVRLFKELGIEGAESLLKSGQALGAEHMALTDLVARTLEAAATEYAQSDPTLAAELVTRKRAVTDAVAVAATKAGQFNARAARTVEHSAEDVMSAAHAIAKERGRELTPAEEARTHELGETLERSFAQTEVAAVEAGAARRADEKLKGTISRAEAGDLSIGEMMALKRKLDSLREKVKRREQKLSDIDAQLPKARKVKPRVSARAGALALLGGDEDALRASVRAALGLGQADALKMAQAEGQTKTPEFKQWFGDSKVVNEQGEPLVVYHGTQADFDTFDHGAAHDKEGKSLGLGWGRGVFSFARDPHEAAKYALRQDRGKGYDAGNPNVMPVYLSLSNPFDIRNGQNYERYRRARDGWRDTQTDIYWGDYPATRNRRLEAFIKQLKAEGYDGIIEGEKGAEEYVAFEQTQIKSAIGNVGTFDTNDPNILKMAQAQPGAKLDADTFDNLARLGALKLLRAPRGSLSVAQFKQQMLNEYGQGIAADIDRIHAEAVKTMRGAIRASNRQKELDRIARRPGNEDLAPEEIEQIAQDERAERKRLNLIAAEHDKAARKLNPATRRTQTRTMPAPKLGPPKPPPLMRAIARQAKTDLEALSAWKLAQPDMTPGRFVREMTAEQSLMPKAARAAFKEAGRVLEAAKAEIKDVQRQARILKRQPNPTAGEFDQALATLEEARKSQARARRAVIRQFKELRGPQGPLGSVVKVGRAVGHGYQQFKGALVGLRAGGDVSWLARQALPGILMHPSQAPKLIAQSYRALWDTEFRRDIDAIAQMPKYPIMQASGVEFTEVGKSGDTGEDIFAHNELLEHIPIVRTYARKSEQGFSAPMDLQRFLLMGGYIDQLQAQGITLRTQPEAYKALGKLVNILSARGDIHDKNRAAIKLIHGFGKLFSFSSRLRPSRIQLLTLPLDPTGIFWTAPPAARRIIWKETAKWYAYLGVVAAALAALGLYSGKKLSEVFDPDNPDYMYLPIGKLRIDLTRGHRVEARLFHRLAAEAYRRASGQVTGGMSLEYGAEATARYLRGGLDPAASLAVDWWTGKNYEGDPFHWSGWHGAIATSLMPMLLDQALQAQREQGGAYGAATLGAEFIGLGAQAWKDKPDRPHSTAEKLARRFVQAGYGEDPDAPPLTTKQRDELQDVRERARQGADVTADLSRLVQADTISAKQAQNIQALKGLTPFQSDIKHLKLALAKRVLKQATEAEKASVADIMHLKESGELTGPAKDLFLDVDKQAYHAPTKLKIGGKERELTAEQRANLNDTVAAVVSRQVEKFLHPTTDEGRARLKKYEAKDTEGKKKTLTQIQDMAAAHARGQFRRAWLQSNKPGRQAVVQQ